MYPLVVALCFFSHSLRDRVQERDQLREENEQGGEGVCALLFFVFLARTYVAEQQPLNDKTKKCGVKRIGETVAKLEGLLSVNPKGSQDPSPLFSLPPALPTSTCRDNRPIGSRFVALLFREDADSGYLEAKGAMHSKHCPAFECCRPKDQSQIPC